MKTKVFWIALLFLLTTTAGAKIKLPQLLSDNMVLQQETKVHLWGETTPNATINVMGSWGKGGSAKADANGKWIVELQTPSASYQTYHIHVNSSDGDAMKLNDILIGEVWFCSGQSNMEMPLNGFHNCPLDDSNNLIADAANHPYIRVATIARKGALEPQEYANGNWKEPNVKNAPDYSATAYLYALALQRTLQVPVGVINCSWGGTRVEGWMPKEILEKYSDVDLNKASSKDVPESAKPMIMYNGLLYPCINYTIKGFIWYQGCSNVGKANTYAERMQAMVKQWRSLWKEGDIPFYYVEIAPYAYDNPEGINAALLRESQFKAQSLIPNSAMICTNDLVAPYEVVQIHPKNKKDVGERLAYQALNKTYNNKTIVADSPSFKDMKIDGKNAILSFNNANQGFSPWKGITGFEVAGADKVFYPAEASLNIKDMTVVVTSDKVANPVAVRYCFRNFQIGNLKNHRNLPLIPFRTDNW